MPKYTISTDSNSINVEHEAKHVLDLIGLEDGTLIRIAPTEFNVMQNGSLKPIDMDKIDPYMLDVFATFEGMEDRPKYPYLVVITDKSGG